MITFSQLTYLRLDCLPKLTSFCSGSYSFQFPSLEEVIVRQCPKVKAFCHGPLWTPELERVQSPKEDEWHWKAALNANASALEGQIIIPTRNSFVEKGMLISITRFGTLKVEIILKMQQREGGL